MRKNFSVRLFALLSSTLVLGSCAYATKASFQNITFLSPDGQDAKCLVYVNKVKYQVWPPQTVNIKKSDKTMLVVCQAPGNRTIEVEVEPRIEKVTVWGSPVGMAWDYASESLYSYPEVIAIDFSQEELRAFPPPKHNNKDIRQPESYDLEEFLPQEPRLNSDKDNKPSTLMRRDDDSGAMDENVDVPEVEGMEETEATTDGDVSSVAGEKDIQAVVEEMQSTPASEMIEAEGVAGEVIDTTAPSANDAGVSSAPAGSVLMPLDGIVAEGEDVADATSSDAQSSVDGHSAVDAPVVLVPGE